MKIAWPGRRATLVLAGGIAGAVMVASAYSGIVRWLELRAQLAGVECEIERLNARVAELGRVAERLRSDPLFTEQEARKHGFVRPGDLVLAFPPAPRPPGANEAGCARGPGP